MKKILMLLSLSFAVTAFADLQMPKDNCQNVAQITDIKAVEQLMNLMPEKAVTSNQGGTVITSKEAKFGTATKIYCTVLKDKAGKYVAYFRGQKNGCTVSSADGETVTNNYGSGSR